MTEHISRLITALCGQRDIYIKLYGLSVQKRDAIEKNEMEALNKIVKEEEPLLIQLKESERERINLLSVFSQTLELPSEKITIKHIIDICPPSFVAQMKRIHAELSNALQSQVQINDVNRRLIESRLEYISFMMDTTTNELNNSYNTSGSDARIKPGGPRMIDLGV